MGERLAAVVIFPVPSCLKGRNGPGKRKGSNFPVAESRRGEELAQRQCVLHGVRKNAGKWAPGEEEIRRRVRYTVTYKYNRCYPQRVRAQSA